MSLCAMCYAVPCGAMYVCMLRSDNIYMYNIKKFGFWKAPEALINYKMKEVKESTNLCGVEIKNEEENDMKNWML